jgi:hypothetical protein
MPRAVPAETARRRRERLSELIDALGAARGQRVTQREFAASIGREQGTVAAILGGDRALGADVMMAVVQAYRLPSDWFDRPLRPDPRPFARAAVNPPSAPEDGAGVPSPAGGQAFTAGVQAMPAPEQAMPSIASAMHSGGQAMHGIAGAYTAPPASDGALGEALAALAPDRSVAIALEALARMVGHDPRPPSSASAWLAVTTDDAVAGGEARMGAGTQVQSVPAPGEEPQVFEVARDTAVRPTWNALRPRLRLSPPRLAVRGSDLVVCDRVGDAWVPRPQALSELFVEPGKALLTPGGTLLFMAWQGGRMEGAAVRIKTVSAREDGTQQVTLDAVTLAPQTQRL